MNQERRRYFRINDTVGLSYKVMSKSASQPLDDSGDEPSQIYLNKQDKQMLDLIKKLAKKQPEIAALMALFNQKLERLSNLMALDGHRIDSISMQLKEVNISACGIAFHHDTPIEMNSILELDISLLPDDQVLKTQGRVVACSEDENTSNTENTHYIRIDFYAMDSVSQERLIQHIVKNQIIA